MLDELIDSKQETTKTQEHLCTAGNVHASGGDGSSDLRYRN